MAAKTLNLTEIRTFLAGDGMSALSETAIGQFVDDGMPKVDRGKYDSLACASWYLARLRSARERRTAEGTDGKQVSLDEADRRLKLAKAESEEMTLAERRGELVPLFLYERNLTSLVQVTKQRILNIPARLAQKLEGCTTVEIKALLNASLKDALAELSRTRPPRSDRASRIISEK